VCADILGVADKTPCKVIDSTDSVIPLTADCSRPVYLNRSGEGYFTVDYSAPQRVALRYHLGELTEDERALYNDNEWMLTRNGYRNISEYLQIVQAMPRHPEHTLVNKLVENIIFLDQTLAAGADRPAWESFVRKALAGYAPLTWMAPKGETIEQRLTRASVLWGVGYAARDAQVIAGAKRVSEQYMNNPASVDAVIADRALRLAAINGDEAFFNRVIEQVDKASTPEMALRYREIIPLFRDPKLMSRAVEYMFSGKVRSQDIGRTVAGLLTDPATRPGGMEAVKAHWTDLSNAGYVGSYRIAMVAASFCSPEERKEVETLFAPLAKGRGQRMIDRTLEAIDSCIAFRTTQHDSFERTFTAK
jgi:aminopeptidase N/puromycin-sensitive aminopeptidase